MKKRFLTVAICFLLALFSVTSSAVTMYARDGRTFDVPWSEVEAYKAVGWYEGVTVWAPNGLSTEISPFKVDEYKSAGWLESVTMWATDGSSIKVSPFNVYNIKANGKYSDNKDDVTILMYAADGRTKRVFKDFVYLEREVGWFTAPPVQMWAADGRTKYVEKSLVQENIKVGWYTEPVVQMWAADGRTKYVVKSQVQANKNVGWFDNKASVMVTMYAPDGRTKQVFKGKVTDEKAVGWGTEPWVLMWAADGRNKYVAKSQVQANKNVGWYDNKADVIVTMYAPDGRTKQVFKNQVTAHKVVGWYTEPVVQIWAADGRTRFVVKSQVQANKNVGWYDNKADVMVTMYAPDGRTKQVFKGKVAAEVAVGWSTEPFVTMYAPDGRTKKVPESRVNAETAVGWSIYPPGSYVQGPHNTTVLNAEQVYKKCSPAVFTIITYDKNRSGLSQGSGFFIDSNGTAITNYHVIKDGYYATAYMQNTDIQYKIIGVYSYDKDNDWAVIKVDCSGNPYLNVGDKSTVVGGAAVFAIGTPNGLTDTISQGIISNPSREINGYTHIQTDTAITSGNSGGALINKYGEVIGINTMVYGDGSLGLNFAVPVYQALGYSTARIYTLGEMTESHSSTPVMKPQQKPGSTNHAKVINYIISNGDYDEDDGYYSLSYTYVSESDTSCFVSLMYFVKDDELILGYLADRVTMVVDISKPSSSYDFHLSLAFDDGGEAEVSGKIYAGKSLTEAPNSAVLISSVESKGEKLNDPEVNKTTRSHVGTITALSTLIADTSILNSASLSIADVFNIVL